MWSGGDFSIYIDSWKCEDRYFNFKVRFLLFHRMKKKFHNMESIFTKKKEYKIHMSYIGSTQ